MKKFKFLFALVISSIVLICCILAVSATKWTDVPDNAWYTGAVVKANELGIMNGTSNTTFAPLKNLTRAEYVAILFRLADGEADLPYTFTDIPAGAWYGKYVGWAEKSGVITGYGNAQTFGGTAVITREQLMLMTSRFMDYQCIGFYDSDKAVEFKDADKISSWAAKGVEATRRSALITGDANGNFNPQAPATRAEIATIVVRYVEALPTAVDAMHVKLANILSLVETQSGKHIKLTFASGGDVALNYYNDNTIRGQLFSQMGLDVNKYEMIISDKEMDSLREPFTAMSSGAFSIQQVDAAIKNKLTGEVTKTYKLSLMLKKQDVEFVTVDPDNFDHGLDETIYSEAIDISLYNEGNVARLAEFFKKGERGENITVGYLGGSITAGASALPGRSWAETTQRWIEKYVDSDAKYINSGIHGTSSALGLLRLDLSLLSTECDLIFVEFAVNDTPGSPFHRRGFETLIRTILEDENAPAVVIVLSASDDTDDDRYEYMMSVGKYYGVPVVDTHHAVKYIFENTDMTYHDYANDAIHPQNYGHRIMGDMVINLLKNAKEKAKTATTDELKIKKPDTEWITDDLLYGMKLYHAADLLTPDSTWKPMAEGSMGGFNKGISSSSSDDVFTFTFTGKLLTVAPKILDGTIEVSIDGGEYFEVACSPGLWIELFEICYFDTVGTHTVSMRIPTRYNGTEYTLYGFGIA